MNELIKQALEEYFTDFKEYHLIILIVFTFIIALSQVIQYFIISKKIEKFKNELKKSEIKFSKYNELQIEQLNELYPLLAELLIITTFIQLEIDKSTPEKIKSLTENWGESFKRILSNFFQKKYILPSNIKTSYSELINRLNSVNSYIHAEKEMSSLYATLNNGEVEFMGDDEDRMRLSEELNKVKKEGLLSETIKSITNLQSNIEVYFENIE